MKRQIIFFSTSLFFFLLQPQEVVNFTFLEDHLCHHDDALALLQFKEMLSINASGDASTNCDNNGQYSYPKMTYWRLDTDCCNWHGVTCHNITGRVIELDLSCSQLQGLIHPNTSLFHLSHLYSLNLAFNDFSGSQISHRFGWMKSLTHLNLSYTYFEGEVASEISYLSNLVLLDLSSDYWCDIPTDCWVLRYESSNFEAMLQNLTHLRVLSLETMNISSELRVNFSSSLRYLNLADTGIRGNIPSDVFHLPKVQDLFLGENENLAGSLPKFNCSISSPLRQLSLWGTNLTGELPDSIGCIQSLKSLFLSSCQIYGAIPESIGNITQITNLRLNGNLLVGEFPSPLLNFPHLEVLDLSNNLLSGSIPPLIFTFSNLYFLDLSSNNFSGIEQYMFANFSEPQNNTFKSVNISYPDFRHLGLSSCQIKEFPEFLRNSESLSYLELSNNIIRGEIPNWFMSMTFDNLFFVNLSHNFLIGTIDQLPCKHLEYLDMSSNSLQGQIPSSICDSSLLEILDLSNNNLSCQIPECLGNSSQSLYIVDLGNNRLFGAIPSTFSKGNILLFLMLNDNQLQGPVPRSLAHCNDLELLDLGNNKIEDQFPIWLETLTYLEVIILKSNRFHGAIGNCQTKSPFPQLRIIDASHNELTGALPEELLNYFKAMKNSKSPEKTQYMAANSYMDHYYIHSMDLFIKGVEYSLERVLVTLIAIDFSSNRLEGQIPEIIGSLHSLQILNLSHNNFNGHIPKSLGNLSMLESLDLSWNQLEGSIPREILNLEFLGFLNLSENHLVGSIPQGRHFDTFGNDSYRGNLALCGFPLTKVCEDTEAQPPPMPLEVEQQHDSQFFDGFTWKAVLLGYGCGLVLGLTIGGLIFLTGKPRWFVQIVEESCKLQKQSRKWFHTQT